MGWASYQTYSKVLVIYGSVRLHTGDKFIRH